MARPKKEQIEARGERLSLRLRPAELNELTVRAAAAGLTLSEFARAAALQQLPATSLQAPARLVDPALILAINRVGTNLNQIARGLNAQLGFTPEILTDALARVNAYLDEVQR